MQLSHKRSAPQNMPSKTSFGTFMTLRECGAVLSLLFILFGMTSIAHANNPGGHMVQLSWNADPTCIAPACTINIYKGTAAGVCGKGKTPFANVAGTSYEDDSVVGGTTYFYAATEWLQTGGEGPCSTEGQWSVQTTQGGQVNNLQGKSQ